MKVQIVVSEAVSHYIITGTLGGAEQRGAQWLRHNNLFVSCRIQYLTHLETFCVRPAFGPISLDTRVITVEGLSVDESELPHCATHASWSTTKGAWPWS